MVRRYREHAQHLIEHVSMLCCNADPGLEPICGSSKKTHDGSHLYGFRARSKNAKDLDSSCCGACGVGRAVVAHVMCSLRSLSRETSTPGHGLQISKSL